MNLSSLRERARALSGIRLETLRSDEQVDAVLNEAYLELINMTNWPFLRSSQTIAVAANVNTFTSPSGFSEVSSVTYVDEVGNSIRLTQTTIDEIDRLDTGEEGDPFYYARLDESEFEVWPVPNKPITYTVKGKTAVDTMSTDSSQPVFAEQFHPIIAYRAASRMLAEEGDDSGRAEAYQSEASNFYLRMQQFYMRSGDVGMFVMGGRRRRLIDGR